MTRFALKLGAFLPLLLGIVLINYWGDPAKIFQHYDYQKGVAEILLSKRNVINFDFYTDERILQKYYALGLSMRPDILVIGSSRTMEIRQSMFPGKRLYNASVSNATIEDFYGIYGLYRDPAKRPSELILGMDSTVLDSSMYLNSSWQSLAQECVMTENAAGLNGGNVTVPDPFSTTLPKILEILSPSYFQPSLKAVIAQLTTDNSAAQYYGSDSTISDLNVKVFDGSLIYAKPTRDATERSVHLGAISYATTFPGVQITLARAAKLEAFIKLLKSDGVRVTLYLTPYPPEFSETLAAQKKDKMLDAVQDYFLKLAQKYRLDLKGSWRSLDYHCLTGEFFDFAHAKDACVIKALSYSPLTTSLF